MAKVWKILALLLVITALVWLTTMWRWQQARFDPSATELTLTLAVLPVVLTAALVMTLWAVKRLRRYAAAPIALPATSPTTSPAALAPTATPAQAAARTAEDERSASAPVLAAAVQLRAGSRWSSAQAGIASGECKPGLDAQLKDDDGIAVFTAPMPDLSTGSLADALDDIRERLAAASPDTWAGHEAPEEMLRALTLLEACASAQQEALQAQWPVLGAPPPAARGTGTAAAPLPPTVAIRVGIPARWSAQAQQLAGAWLERHFAPTLAAGLQAAGQSQALASGMHAAVQLHVHPVESAEALWLLMERQLQQWQRDRQPGLLWMLAADSLVSAAEVDAMAAAGELFSGQNQRGRVPGEAAAALLLASPTWPEVPKAEPALARLHRASIMRRDKSADAAGRVSPHTLLTAAREALQANGCEPRAVTHLTTDADHRASRTAEVYETLQELLPHLDTSEHTLRLGTGCGDVGIARLLAGAALAATQVQESQSAALLFGAFPAHERLAALLTPLVAPLPAAPGAPAQTA